VDDLEVAEWSVRLSGSVGAAVIETARRYVAWVVDSGRPVEGMWRFEAVAAYVSEVFAASSSVERERQLARLMTAASLLDASVGSPTPKVGALRARPGYSDNEVARFVEVALRHRRGRPRQHLCAVVGFGAGAGLDFADLSTVYAGDVQVRDEGGQILVQVGGRRPRVSVVRREFEPLVQVALEGLEPSRRLVGAAQQASEVLRRVELPAGVERPDSRRLRTTWIGWLMRQRVPVEVLLAVSGLRSGYTFEHVLIGSGELPSDPRRSPFPH
jgi:hypothetical protein